MNALAIHAFYYGPLAVLLVTSVPIPLRVKAPVHAGRIIWFWTGMVWLSGFVLAAAGFTVWWLNPDRWYGHFSWNNLIIPLWVLGLGVAVATVRLVRRTVIMARHRTSQH